MSSSSTHAGSTNSDMSRPARISSISAPGDSGPSPTRRTTISPDSISDKVHSTSPPRPKSPMPPTASLTATSTEISQISSQHQQNKPEKMSGSSNKSGGAISIPSPPAEVEATLSKLTSHSNVIGVLVLSRPEALVIRSGGAYFEPSGPGARERAMRLKSVVEMVRNAVLGLEKDIPKSEHGDELMFLRIRTKKYEMMISPSEKYLLVVLQDPTMSP